MLHFLIGKLRKLQNDRELFDLIFHKVSRYKNIVLEFRDTLYYIHKCECFDHFFWFSLVKNKIERIIVKQHAQTRKYYN